MVAIFDFILGWEELLTVAVGLKLAKRHFFQQFSWLICRLSYDSMAMGNLKLRILADFSWLLGFLRCVSAGLCLQQMAFFGYIVQRDNKIVYLLNGCNDMAQLSFIFREILAANASRRLSLVFDHVCVTAISNKLLWFGIPVPFLGLRLISRLFFVLLGCIFAIFSISIYVSFFLLLHVSKHLQWLDSQRIRLQWPRF